ncbi:MAG: 2-succinyl-6-hydroxy-2,4-cyclohexadiene-1-carboxylate synthase [Myxococcota bacterium]|nr:2-succinyl-6-hydroxy-2,4-cyclohexadiene-1-carboxylate synthase [Myxococcota bacterium]
MTYLPQRHPREHIITAGGLRNHVLEWNPQGSPTALLLHGYLDMAWSWARCVDHLPAHWRVIATDFRGHGDTEPIPRGAYYYFYDYVREVADVMDWAAADPLILVGHSMGGTVASLAAGSFPERISHLVLVEGVGPESHPLSETPERLRVWLQTLKAKKASHEYASVEEVAARLRDTHPRLDADYALFLAEKGTRLNERGKRVWKFDPLHRTRAPIPFHLPQAREFWSRFKGPALLVDADDTWWSPPDLEERYACFSNGRRITIANSGHMIHHDQSERLASEIAAFAGK